MRKNTKDISRVPQHISSIYLNHIKTLSIYYDDNYYSSNAFIS